jgi:oxygen-dependent protoporphyrinogen oxidase
MRDETLPGVAVIGGGISGLTAAHRLATSGASGGARVTLIERAPRLGGKVVTQRTGGFVIEDGPDSFVTVKGSVLRLAAELGIGDRVISSRPEHRGAYVWSRGRLHPIPDGLLLMAPSRLLPILRSSVLSWRGKLRVLGDLFIPRGPNQDQSLEAFVVRRLGREVLERIAEPLVAGIHAAEPATMSLAASFPRFLDMERNHRSLILAARAARAPTAASGGANTGSFSYFASFKNGMGELSDNLTKALADADVRTGCGVALLQGSPESGFQLTLDDGSEVRAHGVILATPARETAALLSGVVPAASALVSGINQVATATVTLVYRSSDVPDLAGSGFVVPSVEGRRVMGVSYLSRKWEGRVPNPNLEMLRVFIGGSHGQELANSDEASLVAVAREELALILGVTANPVQARSQVWPGGLHQYTLGHLERLGQIESALAGYPSLRLAGAGFYGIGLNECVESGRNAADAVLQGLTRLGFSEPPVVLDSGGAH